MESLNGKTALITGGAKRLGRAFTEALAAEGANVVIHFNRSACEAESLSDELAGAGIRAWTVRADLANLEEAAALPSRAQDIAGPIDYIINSASIFPESSLRDVTPEAIHANLDINALSPFLIGRAFAGLGRPGAIVNMLDCMIADYDRKHIAYHLSKRTLFSLTRMMAVEFAPLVRVNAIAPGLVLPPEGKDESYLANLASSNPLNRYGGAEDVAAAAIFLLKSTFITGQLIYVDGGRNLRGAMYG
ncbi:MAG: SDR family oxidoreductase [Candidatus Hydrogenedentes bacterium]|nr:SDR family oxidoreductase [Candidatus Hydrogenedentota bacterium]